MKRKIISVLFVTVLALVLTNCGATQVAPLTNPTAAAVPTATPVPPPPTATPTPVPPTPTPTIPDFMKQQGFQENSQLALASGTTIFPPFVVDKSQAYSKGSDEFVLAYTMALPDDPAAQAFQAELKDPNKFVLWGIGMLGGGNINVEKQLSSLEGIGDSASGATFSTTLFNVAVKADAVVFQHGKMGALVIVIHGADKEPTTSAPDFARRFDSTIVGN